MAEAVVAALKREYRVIDLISKNPVLLDVAVADQVPLMLVWFHSEGGGTHNNNFFNPLNTKRGAGAIYKNGYFPVFGNCQDGVAAILKTITNPDYPKYWPVIKAIIAGDRNEFINALAASPWDQDQYDPHGNGAVPGRVLRGISNETATARGSLLVSPPLPQRQ